MRHTVYTILLVVWAFGSEGCNQEDKLGYDILEGDFFVHFNSMGNPDIGHCGDIVHLSGGGRNITLKPIDIPFSLQAAAENSPLLRLKVEMLPQYYPACTDGWADPIPGKPLPKYNYRLAKILDWEELE